MNDTAGHSGMIAETVAYTGANGDLVHAYFARPTGPGPFPSVVLLHHMPGWDEWYFEITRRFAHHGYAAFAPDLYCRVGHGTPDEVTAQVRADGGVPDTQVVGDVEGALTFLRALPTTTGKVGLFGTCSGGRHAYLSACQLGDQVDAVVDCWGGGVVMAQDQLTEKRPVAPIDMTSGLTAPVLGLFGDQDRSPTPEQVAEHEAVLTKLEKKYSFHMYEGAGHGFFYYDRPAAFRAEAASDGWAKLWEFFGEHLGP